MEDFETGDKIEQLNNLPVWQKIAEGDIHLVTQKDIQQLFSVMDDGRKGYVSGSDLMTLQAVDAANLSEHDLQELVKEVDKDGNSKCSPEELYHAITSGAITFNIVKESLRKKEIEVRSYNCDREKLLEWMKTEYETTAALWSLPMTIGSFITFALVANTHIDLFNAWRVHNALQEQFPVMTLPYKFKVVDIPTLNKWTEDYYIPTVFRQDPVYDPIPGRIAHHNQMVTGIRFAKFFRDPQPCPLDEVLSRVFNSVSGNCYFEGELKSDFVVFPYQLERPVLLETFKNMTRQPWLDEAVERLEYQVFTYNAMVNLYTLEKQEFTFELDGRLIHRFQHESFIAEPYLSVLAFVPDVAFLLLSLRSVYVNLKEVVPALMAGLDGLINYLTFWKSVEWISLLFGIGCFILWVTVYLQITVELPEEIAKLPKQDFDEAVREKGQYLDLVELQRIMSIPRIAAVLNDIMTVGNKIRDNHEFMRNLFALNFVALILRFFKSFTTNPRLDVVIQTIVDCTPNVAHFFIVYFSLFVSFAFAGHFLFGSILEGYSTALASLFTRYRKSMTFEVLNEMPVGHQILGYTWVWSYQLLMPSLILSMLIGIVFGSYYAIQSRVGEPVTLWTQVRKAIQTAAETRNFMSLWSLIVSLEDDDYPAHPQKTVTAKSLKKAFEKERMTRQNAEYLVRKGVEYIKANLEQPVLDLPDAVKIIGNSFNIMQKNEEILEQSVIVPQSGPDHDFHAVGMVQSARSAQVNNPSHEESSSSDNPVDVLEKGIMNLTDLLADLHHSHNAALENMKAKVVQEHRMTLQRQHRLKGHLDEFKSRVVRAQRGIGRLKSFVDTADFGGIAHIPEQMENDLMRCFGSRPALARENLSPSEVNHLERQCQELLKQLNELSGEFSSLVDCQPIIWELWRKCRSQCRTAHLPGVASSPSNRSNRSNRSRSPPKTRPG